MNDGTIVFVVRSYGDAKPHNIFRIVSTHRDYDRGGGQKVASVDFLEGGSMGIPVELLVPFPQQAYAQKLFDQYKRAGTELWQLRDQGRALWMGDTGEEIKALTEYYEQERKQRQAQIDALRTEYTKKREELTERRVREYLTLEEE